MNEGHELYAACVFNEDHKPPPEFLDGARGLKTDTAYKIIADLMIEIISQQEILLAAINNIDVDAATVKLIAGGGTVVECQPGMLGLNGASPIPRRVLPPPATTLPTALTLVNAIRQLLIDLGPAM